MGEQWRTPGGLGYLTGLVNVTGATKERMRNERKKT
jgi:hypothetical protein